MRFVGAVVLTIAACGTGAGGPAGPDGTQAGGTPTPALVEYVDPARRFLFDYPETFGRTSDGTNNGFADRVAAVRFSVFSSEGIGGEAVVTRGRPLVDIQTVGGLYDSIAREAFPAAVLALVDSVLPSLNPGNFCGQLGREDHVDVNDTIFAGLTAVQREAVRTFDRMGNIAPLVLECAVSGDLVTFHKEAAVVVGGPRRRIFGAVRFLEEPYSSFQIVQARTSVPAALLSSVRAAVASWRVGGSR